jgi:hypothetical protein
MILSKNRQPLFRIMLYLPGPLARTAATSAAVICLP